MLWRLAPSCDMIILRNNQLIFEKAPTGSVKDFIPAAYPGLIRIVENNILYLANLKALEAWYTHVRKPFLEAQQFGSLIYAGAMDQLSAAKKERLKRLKTMAEKAVAFSTQKRQESLPRKRQELV